MAAVQEKVYSIGIIGGGKVGLDLFQLFSQSKYTCVKYVVDRDVLAPAVMAAKKAGVETFDSIDNALTRETDFLLEVTGSDRVVEMLRDKMNGTSGDLITHNMAYIILQTIDDNNKKVCGSVANEVGNIKGTIDKSLNETESMIEQIDEVTSEMRILALNARIEAARVGDAGRGFALVAQQMSKLTDTVREIAMSMEQITESVRATSDRIETSMHRLN